MKVTTAPSTPENTMPTKGTSSTSRGGRARISRRNSAVAATADRLATTILAQIGAAGAQSVMARRPSAAPSAVPVVPGSTKRLRTSCCITTPAMASAAPVRITASVRGRRDKAKTCASIPAAPTSRLTAAKGSNTASRIRQARPIEGGGRMGYAPKAAIS